MEYKIITDMAKVLIKNLNWDIAGCRSAKCSFEKTSDGGHKYVISRNEMVGLFSYVETTMRETVQAVNKDMVPVVDMTGCRNPYLDSTSDNKNWWELYFDQPTGNGGKVLKITAGKGNGEVPHSRIGVLEKRSRWYWGKVYEAYFKPNNTVMEYFNKEYELLLGAGSFRTLGVLVRGTDYKGAKGHPVQPSVDEVIRVVKSVAHKYDKIYIATEEQKNVKAFEQAFTGKVITNKRNYFDGIDMSGKTINDIRFERENDGYLSGLEYLSSILLLSKCDGLVAGICGGSVAAVYINNNKYRYLKLLYNGLNK